MFKLLIILALINSALTRCCVKPGIDSINNECVQRIYQDCNHPTHFTDKELENVRQFLNYSFTVLADIKPDKPLCRKLHVRHDWKCLSQQQKERVLNVWKVMYKRGDIQRLSDLHYKTWAAWHKTGESGPAHRWITTEFEKIMHSIDHGTTLPYWEPYLYGVHPELSSIWERLGHSGNYSNFYDVPDGIYPELQLVPTVKRHWSKNGTILPWITPELLTFMLQTSQTYSEYGNKVLGSHFQPHLNVGGYEGQYSVHTAPYDVFFFLHHCATSEIQRFRWQLFKKENLTPLSYNSPGKLVLNQFDGSLKNADIFTDTLTGVPWVTIRETFWVGFGDYCFIPDQLVRPINNIMKGIRDPIPTAAKRLPKWIIEKYFPAFHSGNYSHLYHTLEEVGECNSRCLPLPKPTFMRDTEQGKRQFEVYRFEQGIDLTQTIVDNEDLFLELWSDLNKAGYCSPYVTS